MRLKSDVYSEEMIGDTSANNVLDQFDAISSADEYTPLEVSNRGRTITLHIKPADYSDRVHHQYALQQALLASMNVKEAVQVAQSGEDATDIAIDALKGLNFELESAAHTKFAYSLLAKNIREIAELTDEQLSARGVTREEFVAKFLDALATETVYNTIMGLGKKKADKHADKTLDIANVVKN